MGRRGASDSAMRAIGLFLERSVWVQAELARALGLTTDATRAVLRSLCDAQVPLRSERRGPQVQWRLDEAWLAGSVRISKAMLPEFYALILSTPRAPGRERFVRELLAGGGWSEKAVDAIVPATMPDEVDRHARALLESVRRRQCLAIKYHSQSSGDLSWRDVSPQLVEHAGTARVIAWCHRSAALKVFRIDRIQDSAARPALVFRETPRAEVEDFLRGGVNGYRGAVRVPFWFEVRRAERWIEDNLPSMVTFTKSVRGDRVRVEGEVAGHLVLSRFVASLGGHVLAMDPGLAAAVRDVAEGALAAANAALNAGSVPSIHDDAPGRIALIDVRRVARKR
jgi:WYL domain